MCIIFTVPLSFSPFLFPSLLYFLSLSFSPTLSHFPTQDVEFASSWSLIVYFRNKSSNDNQYFLAQWWYWEYQIYSQSQWSIWFSLLSQGCLSFCLFPCPETSSSHTVLHLYSVPGQWRYLLWISVWLCHFSFSVFICHYYESRELIKGCTLCTTLTCVYVYSA